MKSFEFITSITNGEFLEELKALGEKELLVLIAFELYNTQLMLKNLKFTTHTT